MPRYLRGALAAVFAVVFAAVAQTGVRAADAGVLAVLVIAMSVGWPALTRIAQPWTASVVIALAGGGAIAIGSSAWSERGLGTLLGVIGLTVVAGFIREMIRPVPRPALVANLSAVVAGATGAALIGGWMWVPGEVHGAAAIPLACAAVAVSGLVGCLRLHGPGAVALMTGAGGVAAVIAWALVGDVAWPVALGLGIVIGLGTGLAHAAFDRVVAARKASAWVAAAVVPMAIAVLPAYVVAIWVV